MSAYCVQGTVLRALYSRLVFFVLFFSPSSQGTSPVSLNVWGQISIDISLTLIYK